MPLVSHPLPCKPLIGALLFLTGLCLSLQDVAPLLSSSWTVGRDQRGCVGNRGMHVWDASLWSVWMWMVRVCVQQPQCGECSVVSDPWTVAPLPMEFSRQEYWSGWGSSWPRDRTRVSCISCIGRWILYPYASPHRLCRVCYIYAGKVHWDVCIYTRQLRNIVFFSSLLSILHRLSSFLLCCWLLTLTFVCCRYACF